MVKRLWGKMREWWRRWFGKDDNPPDQIYPLW